LRTRVFCCRALFTNARYMSFRSRSPCLILEFVEMGREKKSSGKVVVGEVGEERRDEDNFLCLARDWRAPPPPCCCDRCLAKPSNEGEDFPPSESIICLCFGMVGPAFAFGGRWLYCDSLECGSIKRVESSRVR
jgi:hypothetical protein